MHTLSVQDQLQRDLNYISTKKKMTVTVCFDALGTCFSLQPVIEALDSLLGLELRLAGSDARMTIMDWVCGTSYLYRSP
jgi:hypothetical protein